jgi:cell division initiation protein
MRITPLDIIQVDFTQTRRGFDPEEVKAFLEKVRESLEEALKENHRLKELLSIKDEEIATLRQNEAGIKETLILSRQLASEVRRAANREADMVVGEARIEAERVLMAAQDEHRTLMEQVTRLRVARTQLAAGLRAILETQVRLLEEIDEAPTAASEAYEEKSEGDEA